MSLPMPMKFSRRLVLFLSLAAIVHLTRAADNLKAMGGKWQPAAIEVAGRPLPPAVLKTISLKIDGANYEVVVQTENGPSPDKGTVKLDPSTKPKRMTITGVEGPNAGKTYLAIYEFNGDTLRVCYDLGGTERPTEFKTAPETKLFLVTYERVK